MAPRPPVYLVFAGVPEVANPIWLEADCELGIAKCRMRELAEQTPGAYFVCKQGEGAATDRIDTTPQPKRVKQVKAGAA